MPMRIFPRPTVVTNGFDRGSVTGSGSVVVVVVEVVVADVVVAAVVVAAVVVDVGAVVEVVSSASDPPQPAATVAITVTPSSQRTLMVQA